MMTIISSDVITEEAPSQSAVSWGAILAGAMAAIAATFVMAVLGSGLGLSVISPWSGGISIATFAVSTVIWMIVTQWVSSALAGYIAGRLRTKWVGVHSDEVFFRDTAHGFLAWCVGTIFMAALLVTAISGLASKAVETVATVGAEAAGKVGEPATPTDYFIDLLYRSPSAGAGANAASDMAGIRAETSRILAAGLASDTIPAGDRAYLAQLVAGRTGLSQTDAEKRVDDVLAQIQAAKAKAKQVADVARKATLLTALLSVVAFLVGAFIASVAAALGGQLRDLDSRRKEHLESRL